MKISIITCTYNRQNKLIRNINSVVNQINKNIEHYIVDDGSTDETLEELKKLNYKHIKVISLKNNLGQPAALYYSKVFEIVTGDIYFLLDSDDYLLPGALDTIESDFNYYNEKNKNFISINYSYEVKNKDLVGYSFFPSKNIFRDNYPRNINKKGFKDYLSVRKKKYISEQLKYFKRPDDWYLSYYDICANNNFEEIFTNKNIYKMEFGQDTVTKGLNIEKYSKWSLNTRMMIYKNYRSIMDKEYLQYSIRSLFFNYLVNENNNLNKLKLILNEKFYFLKNFHLVVIFLFSLLVPSKIVLNLKKFLKSKKKIR